MVEPQRAARSQAEMAEEIERLRDENARLRDLLGLAEGRPSPAVVTAPWKPTLFTEVSTRSSETDQVDRRSSPAAKVALFLSLFAGRKDVYAVRW